MDPLAKNYNRISKSRVSRSPKQRLKRIKFNGNNPTKERTQKLKYNYEKNQKNETNLLINKNKSADPEFPIDQKANLKPDAFDGSPRNIRLKMEASRCRALNNIHCVYLYTFSVMPVNLFTRVIILLVVHSPSSQVIDGYILYIYIMSEFPEFQTNPVLMHFLSYQVCILLEFYS